MTKPRQIEYFTIGTPERRPLIEKDGELYAIVFDGRQAALEATLLFSIDSPPKAFSASAWEGLCKDPVNNVVGIAISNGSVDLTYKRLR